MISSGISDLFSVDLKITNKISTLKNTHISYAIDASFSTIVGVGDNVDSELYKCKYKNKICPIFLVQYLPSLLIHYHSMVKVVDQ